MVLHRTRHLYVRQMTAVINALRAHLAEFGIVAPQRRNGVAQLVGVINDCNDERIPELVRTCMTSLSIQLGAIKQQIAILDRRLIGLHRTNESSKRLDAIPGVGSPTSTSRNRAQTIPRGITHRNCIVVARIRGCLCGSGLLRGSFLGGGLIRSTLIRSLLVDLCSILF